MGGHAATVAASAAVAAAAARRHAPAAASVSASAAAAAAAASRRLFPAAAAVRSSHTAAAAAAAAASTAPVPSSASSSPSAASAASAAATAAAAASIRASTTGGAAAAAAAAGGGGGAAAASESRHFGRPPARVHVCEVGPRDGLQNESRDRIVPLQAKESLVLALERAGVRRLEVGSFVLAPRVPQMADSGELLERLVARRGALAAMAEAEEAEEAEAAPKTHPHPQQRHRCVDAVTARAAARRAADPFGPVTYPVLVPNRKGLERAVEAGAEEVALFAASTEAFSQKNTNMSIAQALERAQEVVDEGRRLRPSMRFRGYVSTVMGCPYEGVVPVEQVVKVALAMRDMGVYEISLGDTIGVGNPGQVHALLHALLEAGIPVEMLAAHFHDTYGQALSNTLVALQFGVPTVDSSVAGLGGCPFAKGATGNVATEDVVFMLHGMGIETGIDLDRLMEAGVYITKVLGKDVPASRVTAAAMRRGSLPDTYYASLPPAERERLDLHRADDEEAERLGIRNNPTLP